MAMAVESRRAVESAERATYAGHLLDNCFCGSGGSKVEQRVGVYVCVCVCERECAARVYYQPLKNTLFFAERTEF